MTMPVKIGAPALPPLALWQMNAKEFNDWRTRNDFPRIVDYFKKHLKDFNVWLAEYHIDENDLINFGIANFLVMEEFVFLSRPKTNFKCLAKIEISPGGVSEKVTVDKLKSGDRYKSITGASCHVLESKVFQPYLIWAKTNKVRIHPHSPDGRIRVTTIEGVLSPEHCRAYIFDELELLKMGGMKSHNSWLLHERDLAFVNLDFIDFQSNELGSSYGKQIIMSSARYWNFTNSDESFFYFLDTNLDNMQIKECKIYGWKWFRCDGNDSMIKDSRLNRCVFGPGLFVPYFDNVDLTDSELESGYERNHEYGCEPRIELVRMMKNVFSERGRSSNAGKLYIIECRIQRIDTVKLIKSSLVNILRPWRGIKASLMSVSMIIKNCALWLSLLIQDIWWGYGEKPSRILLIFPILIILSSVFIHELYSVVHGKTIFDSLWYSVISFIPLGDADFRPEGWVRLIVGLDGMMGILGFGFLVSGFAGKNRY
jgi:hypothetical protein